MKVSRGDFAQRRDVRRVHRLAGRAPVRRPHDRAAQRRVRGRDRDRRAASRREEILTYVTVVAGAGNETTTRLIGWAGKVLAEHPDQRRELVDDPSLIPNAIEELLRFEPPAPHAARHVTKDVDYYGQTGRPRAARAVPDRLGQPRRAQVHERRPVRHPPRDRAASRSASAPTSASAPRWPGSRARRARRGAQALPRVDRRHDRAELSPTSTVRAGRPSL